MAPSLQGSRTSSMGSPSLPVGGRSLESQGVELLRLGTDSRGRGELQLRVRLGDEVIHARLAEDGAGGVRVSLGGSLGEARMQRLAEVLASQGHEARLESNGGGPGGQGHRRGRPSPSGEDDRDASPGAPPVEEGSSSQRGRAPERRHSALFSLPGQGGCQSGGELSTQSHDRPHRGHRRPGEYVI